MHKAFFGDGERDFTLTAKLIPELERLTGKGIGALTRHVAAGDYTLAEINETIRLALIGGGTAPKEAAALVATYVPARPLQEAHLLALAILAALMFGSEAQGTKGESDA